MSEGFYPSFAEVSVEEPHMPASSDCHIPVLVREVLEYLQPGPGQIICDCTLGGGGHSEAFLEKGAETVIGFDQDPEAINFASLRLGVYLGRFRPVQANFETMEERLHEMDIHSVDRILADIGISSWQIDTPERGFSFQADGELDMRMSPSMPKTAADIVNTASQEELTRIFREYGDEPLARRAAARIVRDRAEKPFTRTLQLADSIASALPRKGRIHPATRCFQALRIVVNRELEVLENALPAFVRMLKPGGRLGIITFHSGEDRIVKNYFRHRATEWLDRPEWPAPRRNPDYALRLITNRPVSATEEEQQENPRSRSAKLRVVERI